ncbi:MAG: hypothetical protein JW932_14495, partial [Deltaproteobacteria bacterium]|nr:hypothetical protein [Deltaproteobacteria bacterium]
RCLLFVPVLNSIRRSDGGGEKAMSAFGCEPEKRSPYPRKPFLDKHDSSLSFNVLPIRVAHLTSLPTREGVRGRELGVFLDEYFLKKIHPIFFSPLTLTADR